MAKIGIVRQDGSPTPYFYWSMSTEGDPTKLPVYKNASHKVERVKGVFFNAVTNRMART